MFCIFLLFITLIYLKFLLHLHITNIHSVSIGTDLCRELFALFAIRQQQLVLNLELNLIFTLNKFPNKF